MTKLSFQNQDGKKRLVEIISILKKYNLATGMTPQNLTALLEDLGPTFVKLGQIMSMQPNILPPQYCEELGKLKANVSPMEYDEIISLLEAEYGTSLGEIFSAVDPAPLGSASIAQVHTATLTDGLKVAVKIQRPGIYDTMYQDIQLIKKALPIVKFVTKMGKNTDINMVLDELWATAKQEMDFIHEAENAREFYDNNIDVEYITCPRVISEYSTSKVLVMEYIDGYFIDDLQSLKENGYNLEDIAEKLAHNFVKQVVDDGFFHADPHCGNILIKDGKIVWIDLGMMGRVSDRDKKLFTDAVTAIVEHDIEKLTDVALKVGVYEEKIDHTSLSDDIAYMLNKYGSIDFNTMDFADVVDDFLSILREHKIGVPKGVSMLARAISTIQGTLRTIDPDMIFIQMMANYMSSSQIKNFKLKNELQSMFLSFYSSFRKSLDIPAQVSTILKTFSRGNSRLNMKLSMSDDMTHNINKMINRLVAVVIAGALLVGSSLITTTDMEPKILKIPALGLLGFLIAFILGVWLLIPIIKKNK